MQIWEGVGHWNQSGGGPRNPFGLDFDANGRVWNTTLCELDSDQDGQTNGVELGDPNCTWTGGADIPSGPATSHPGFCDPIYSEDCIILNMGLYCYNQTTTIAMPGIESSTSGAVASSPTTTPLLLLSIYLVLKYIVAIGQHR